MYKIRGPTWTDEEVHKLFHVWSLPSIFNGFLNEKRKREVFFQVSSELNKLNVARTWEECRAKIKNLKGEYKKARDSNAPHTFKYYSLMEKILNTAPGQDKTISLMSDHQQQEQQQHVDSGQPMQIEFEIMPGNEIDFRGMKGDLPLELSHGGSTIIIPHSNFMPSDLAAVDVHAMHTGEGSGLALNSGIPTTSSGGTTTLGDDSNSKSRHATHTSVEMGHAVDAEDGTPVIVITTTETTSVGDHATTTSTKSAGHSESEPSSEAISPRRYPYRESYTNAGKRQQKMTTGDINQKRRKLQHLSEKMAETVDRVLTRTTDALIQELKASEERFMEWEEKKRQEEQQREEKLLQSFVAALRSKPGTAEEAEKRAAAEEEKESQERQRILSMIQSSDDPCAVTFDLLATRLTTMLSDQQKETEQNLYQWEAKMQKQEMKHTENLFQMILTAVKSHNSGDDCL